MERSINRRWIIPFKKFDMVRVKIKTRCFGSVLKSKFVAWNKLDKTSSHWTYMIPFRNDMTAFNLEHFALNYKIHIHV